MIAGAAWFLVRTGYVRADPSHTRVADALLLLLTIGYLLLRRGALPRVRPLLVAMAAAVAIAVAAVVAGPIVADQMREQWSWMHHRSQQMTRLEHELAVRSGAASIPAVSGTIDAFPWGSAALIVRKMQYAPRPVFQSCMVWTPSLAELNASFLRGAHAPEWLWAGVGSIDGHLPLLDDAASWLEIVRRYEIAAHVDHRLLLRRRTAPKPLVLAPYRNLAARFGEQIPLPDGNVLWCAMDLRPALATRIRTALGRPPAVTLETTTADGVRSRWVVPAAMLRGGFLLSPQVTDTAELSMLLAGDLQQRVTRIRLDTESFGETYVLRVSAVKGLPR